MSGKTLTTFYVRCSKFSRKEKKHRNSSFHVFGYATHAVPGKRNRTARWVTSLWSDHWSHLAFFPTDGVDQPEISNKQNITNDISWWYMYALLRNFVPSKINMLINKSCFLNTNLTHCWNSRKLLTKTTFIKRNCPLHQVLPSLH